MSEPTTPPSAATPVVAPATAPSAHGFSQACQPRNYQEAMHFCERLSKSKIVPKNFESDPMAIFVCIEMGERLGYSILQSLQNIAVINGKPTIYGDELLARVRRSGLLESMHEEVREGVATCTVKRKGEEPTTRTFSMDQARKANLAGKQGPWQQYPERMLQMRARSFALRDVFTDALSGLDVHEAVADEILDARTGLPAERPQMAQVVEHGPLDGVLKQIAAAQTPQDLEAVADKAKQLAPQEASVARQHFVDRRREFAVKEGPKPTKAQRLLKKVATTTSNEEPADWQEALGQAQQGGDIDPQDAELFK